jgi:hypothetical protein
MGASIGGSGFPQRPSTGIYRTGNLPVQVNSPRRTMQGGPVMPRLPQNPYAQFARDLARNLAPQPTQPARLSGRLPAAFWGE